MTPGDIDFSDSNFVDDILENCNILRTRATKAEASLAEAEALIRKNADMINGYLARITELESQILHQTAISACRIEERERLQAQIAALQEIAVEIYAREIYPFNMPIWEHLPEEDTWVDDKLFGKSKRTGKSTYRYHARDQLAKEHPEAFR